MHVEALDVRDRTRIMSLPFHLPKKFADVDILINNAGLALGTNPVDETNLDDVSVMMDTNVMGTQPPHPPSLVLIWMHLNQDSSPFAPLFSRA